MSSIEIYQGSILDVEADAIVNPANSFLRHGGGLAAIIDRAAKVWPHRSGVDLQASTIDNEFRAQRQAIEQYENDTLNHALIPTGGAGWTSAGSLPYKGIIHAVGPIWGGGNYFESQLLISAYHNAFRVARNHRCEHVAAPAISAGIFGVPIHIVSHCAYEVARTTSLRITFALMDEEHVRAFEAQPEMYDSLYAHKPFRSE